MGRTRRGLAWAIAVALTLAVATAHGGSSQQRAPHPPPAASTPGPATATPAPVDTAPAANPADVATVDSIIAALYDTISGPAGQHRDWNRLRSLFAPGARLIAVGRTNSDARTHDFTVEEYITRASGIMEKEGFYEREIARHSEAYSHIAQIFSTYESRHNMNEKPFQRGINSVQLFNDGHRWWVVTIFWEPEIPGHPIPRKYLR